MLMKLKRFGFIDFTQDNNGELTVTLLDLGKDRLGEIGRAWKELAENADRAPWQRTFTPLTFASLTVRNFRCFTDEQELSFEDDRGKQTPWTVVLGNNGVGKTTLLQCALGLYPQIPLHERDDYASRFEDGKWQSYLEEGLRANGHFQVELRLNVATEDGIRTASFGASYGLMIDTLDLELSAEFDGYWFRTMGRSKFSFYSGNPRILGRVPPILWYGATRIPGWSNPQSIMESHSDSDTPFSIIQTLRDPEEWLLNADYAARFQSNISTVSKARLRRMEQLLIKMLPSVRSIRVAPPSRNFPQPRLLFGTAQGEVRYSDLSVGYQTTLSMIVDIATRLFDAYPDSENPLAEPAVILVDELDLHLHPEWQRDIMERLESTFSSSQFFVTTHSPIIAQGSKQANLAVINSRDDIITINNDVDNVKNWRADQILTSDLFGLESSRPPHIEKMIKRRRTLLNRPRSERGDIEIRRIDEILNQLPVAANKTDESAMELIRSIAQKISKSEL